MSDRITVLRNGKSWGKARQEDAAQISSFAQMMGREGMAALGRSRQGTRTRPNTPARGAAQRPRARPARGIEPFDLDISAGEVVGHRRAVGIGTDGDRRLLFGIDRADAGERRIDDRPTSLASPPTRDRPPLRVPPGGT